MFLDPNDPRLSGDPSGDPNSPEAAARKLMLAKLTGLLPADTSMAGGITPTSYQLSPDAPRSGNPSPQPNAFQLPQEAPPAPAASHIDDLMNSGLLTPTQGGQPVGQAPGGQGGPDAGGPAAGAPASKPPMVDRIHDWLQSKLGPSVPPGYAGLLQQAGVSPDELQQAKPGLGSNLWHTLVSGGTGENMKNRLNELVSLHQATQQMGGQQGAMQEQARIREAHQNMPNIFPPLGPEATEKDRLARMQSMSEYLLAHGDLEGAKEMGATARAIWAQPRVPPPEQTTYSGVAGQPGGPYAGKSVDLTVDKTKRPGQLGYIIAEVPKAVTPVDPATAAFRQESLADRKANHDDSVNGRLGARFVTQNKPLVDTAPKYTSFLNALAQAKQGNQAALQTTLYGFVNNTDMNAQMRQGILQKLEQITPGIGAMTEAKFTQALSGKLTPSMIANMEAIVLPLHRTLKALYKQRYDAAVARHPGVADEIPGADELFDIPGAPAPATVPKGRSVKDIKAAAGAR